MRSFFLASLLFLVRFGWESIWSACNFERKQRGPYAAIILSYSSPSLKFLLLCILYGLSIRSTANTSRLHTNQDPARLFFLW